MTSVNRAALLTKMHRILKKHFKPYAPDAKLPLLEQLMFACVLENSPPEQAEQAYKLLGERFFDLNEVRVSSVRELSEVMHMLADPTEAATRVKGLLQSVFEAVYAFDLEPLKKQNLGQAVKQLEKYEGVSPFVLAYATQTALGGHSVPVNQGALDSLVVVGVITEEEAAENRVPGMERAIPKNKGVEFGSLLHQLGVMFLAGPLSPNLRKLLLEIDPNCKDRLPKRASKKVEAPEPPAPAPAEPAPTGKGKKGKEAEAPPVAPAVADKSSGKKKKDGKEPEAKPAEEKKPDPKATPAAKKPEAKAPEAKKPEAKKPEPKQPEPKKSEAKKPEPAKPAPKKKPAAPVKPAAKKTVSKKLAKRKPR